MRRKGAERAAINAPMQGTAADIIKRAMISVDSWILQQPKNTVAIIMQVHDELVFEVDKNYLKEANKEICRLMECAALLEVPLKVASDFGDNWQQAH